MKTDSPVVQADWFVAFRRRSTSMGAERVTTTSGHDGRGEERAWGSNQLRKVTRRGRTGAVS
jgi:hypothetical protein